MMTLRNFIISAFGLILLTQCNTKEDHPTVAPLIAETKVDNPLAGEWKYNNTIWYSLELTFHDDGTFTYHDQSCTGQRFSQGQWTKANGSISLTSFDTFKQKQVVEPIKMTEVTELQKPKRKLKKGQVEYSFVGFKETTVPSFPSANDTVRVYFNNIQLQVTNDTLYCVSSNKLPEQAKFYRTKNNR
jgi:hypothetical protein